MGRAEFVSTIKNYGQEHLMEYYDRLNDEEKEHLEKQVSDFDWDYLKLLEYGNETKKRGRFSPITVLGRNEVHKKNEIYRNMGLQAIRQKKIAAVLLAGGEGSRLGFDGPKGMFDVGISKTISIFELLLNNLKEVVKEAGEYIPLYIMTSQKNHSTTIDFFQKNDYFDYPKDQIIFFVQDMLPSVDHDGKLLMQDRCNLVYSANGNGGWFQSMIKANLLDELQKKGIEWINVFAVDNVLQKIADPVFLGATIASGCESGAKVVRKNDPSERVGVICLEDDTPSIVEYYELTDEMRNEMRDGDYCYYFGVILNYLFHVSSLVRTSMEDMPIHLADKKVKYMEADGTNVDPEKTNAYKFETLVLDMIHLMYNCLPMEVEREKEFAPIKNRSGVDSIETAQKLLKKNEIDL